MGREEPELPLKIGKGIRREARTEQDSRKLTGQMVDTTSDRGPGAQN